MKPSATGGSTGSPTAPPSSTGHVSCSRVSSSQAGVAGHRWIADRRNGRRLGRSDSDAETGKKTPPAAGTGGATPPAAGTGGTTQPPDE